MEAAPLVSVITPTYNQERYIGTCIESVLAQSYQNWEQIIVDDGSSDSTAEVVARYRDRRIRYVHQQHQGRLRLCDTYNKALAQARGPLIAILEGDDFWPPDKLAALVPAFAAPDVVLAYGITQVVSSSGDPVPQTMPSRTQLRTWAPEVFLNKPVGAAIGALASFSRAGQIVFPCATVVRRKSLTAIGGFRAVADGHAVDLATFLHLALAGTFAFVPRVMGYWRRHLSSTATDPQIEDFLRNDCAYVAEFLAKHAGTIGLSARTCRRIRRSWRHAWPTIHLAKGRVCLAQGKWAEARTHFRHALRTAVAPRHVAISLLGHLLSWCHRDFEALAALAGKPDIRDALGLR